MTDQIYSEVMKHLFDIAAEGKKEREREERRTDGHNESSSDNIEDLQTKFSFFKETKYTIDGAAIKKKNRLN